MFKLYDKVSFHLSSSSKVKELQIYILFEVVGENDAYHVIYCFIECGYIPHFAVYFTCFWLVLRKYPILEGRISGCEWEKYKTSIDTFVYPSLCKLNCG